MKQYKYLYILDYSICGIFYIDLKDYEITEETSDEDILHHYGFKPSQCSWMLSCEKLNIVDINKPLK